MRISSNQFYFSQLTSIMDLQTELGRVQEQMASGRKLLVPSDDPAAAVSVNRVEEYDKRLEMYSDNITAADNALSLEETTLASANNIMQQVYETMAATGNGIKNSADRTTFANQLQQHLNQLLSLANTQDAHGKYIFGGGQAAQVPFVRNSSGNYVYQGDDHQRSLSISPSATVITSDPGLAVFGVSNGNGTFATSATSTNTGTGIISTGNVSSTTAYVRDTYTVTMVTNSSSQLAYQIVGATTGQIIPALPAVTPGSAPAYTDGATISANGMEFAITGTPVAGDTFTIAPSTGTNIFEVIKNTIADLTASTTNTYLNNRLQRSADVMKNSMDKVVDSTANLGARMQRLNTQKSAIEDLHFYHAKIFTNQRDADLAEVVSQFTQQTTLLQMMQKTFLQLNDISLFKSI